MLVLDVGCGRRPRGNVNIDLAKEWTPMCYEYEKHRKYDYHQIPNFIRASASMLPFRDKTFDRVISFSVLVYVKTPFKALKEIARVCKGECDIYVPHRFGWLGKILPPKYVSFFNRAWFEQAFRKLDINDYQITLTRKDLPHPYTPIFSVPYGISVHFWVHEDFLARKQLDL